MREKNSPSTTLRINEWEKEFEEKFPDGGDGFGADYEAIKSFISDLLAKEKMELVERIEGMKKSPSSPFITQDNTKEHIALINHIKGVEDGFNQALDDVLSALKSEIQEKEEVIGR